MFKSQFDKNSTSKRDQELNRGLAFLVLITVSVVGSSWLFSLPIYFDVKIAAQILPVLFSLILFFLVTKVQHVYVNKMAPVLGFLLIFSSWSYVIYLNSNADINSNLIKNIADYKYLGMSYSMYLIGLSLIIFWLARYFKFSIYLSLSSILSLISVLIFFTQVEAVYVMAPALLLVASAAFSLVCMGELKTSVVKETVEGFLGDDYLLQSELSEHEIKPELDINTLALSDAAISYDWELILRELHAELKTTTDVDQLFKSMLLFLHGAIEFDAAAVGMLQDKSIKKVAVFGSDEYIDAKSLNWKNLRIRELFTTREPMLSTQPYMSAANDPAKTLHRLDVPVISNNKVLGLVTLFRESVVFDTNVVKLAASIVFHSMIALRQARLQEEINRLNSDSPERKLPLYSREQFVTKVKPVFDKLSRPRECSLFIVEIDALDTVLDNQGRDAGSLLYKSTSRAVMSLLSESDLLGRYGNDGFVVLLDETNLMSAKEIAEKIRIKVSNNKIEYQEDVLSTTVSIGLTIVSDAEDDLSALMRKADMGLFVAKENGCNSVKVSL